MAFLGPITGPASPPAPEPPPAALPLLPGSSDVAALVQISERLHPADCTVFVRLIGRVAELERTLGEAAAMDMLETAIARLHGAMGRA
jgi:hypothetical protein